MENDLVHCGVEESEVAASNLTEYEAAIRRAGIPLEGVSFGQPQYHYIKAYTDVLMKGYSSFPLVANPLEEADKLDRFTFTRRYGFAIPNLAALRRIAACAPIVEVGAGAGYWSYELRKWDVPVVATDKVIWRYDPVQGKEQHPQYGFHHRWTEVQAMEGTAAVRFYTDHTLLLVWPSYNQPWATKVLRAYRGDTFLYVGEHGGGCCADDSFFEELDRGWDEGEEVSIPQWYGIHDALFVYQRKTDHRGSNAGK